MSTSNIYKIKEMEISKLKQDNNFNEKIIQNFFEKHIKTVIIADKIKSEYSINNRGRIDTLALDENNCPIIIEYKKDKIGIALIQALFYKNWLSENKRQFFLEVKNILGEERAKKINWNIRIILVAQEFDEWTKASTKFLQSIELFKFSFYDKFQTLKLEYIKEKEIKSNLEEKKLNDKNKYFVIDSKTKEKANYETALNVWSRNGKKDVTNLFRYQNTNQNIKEIYDLIKNYIYSIDSDITLVKNKDYWTFKKEKNFIDIIFWKNCITIGLNLLKNNIAESTLFEYKGDKGHWGNQDYHIKIKDKTNIQTILPYILKSFKNTFF